jgi:polyisoprenoid-binding protein YceI
VGNVDWVFRGKGGGTMNTRNLTIPKLAVALIAVAALAGMGFAQSQTNAPKMPDKQYSITIDGTASMVGNWACGGDAKVEAEPAKSGVPVPGLAGGVQTVVVTTSVPAIDCGDSTMNKHLRKALKENQFPEIRYEALKYALVDNGSAVQTSGDLTIAGITKPLALGAKLVPLAEGGTKVTGQVEINMRDYGVKPPSLFFGALKVADVVTVKFNAIVRLPHEMTEALFANR